MPPTDYNTYRYANDTGTMQSNTLLLASSTKSVTEIYINSQLTASNVIYCDGKVIFKQRGSITYLYQDMNVLCLGRLTADVDKNSTVVINYVPYDTHLIATTTTASTVATSTMPYTYHDWLFVSGVEIFFLSFIGISMIFSAFKRRT